MSAWRRRIGFDACARRTVFLRRCQLLLGVIHGLLKSSGFLSTVRFVLQVLFKIDDFGERQRAEIVRGVESHHHELVPSQPSVGFASFNHVGMISRIEHGGGPPSIACAQNNDASEGGTVLEESSSNIRVSVAKAG